ncbi:MAG: ABC transporter permease [Flavipsychrobacter sp.]
MIKRFLEHLGRISIMLSQSIRRPENIKVYWKEFIEQCYDIGIRSLPIVLIISFFLGAVLTIQTAYQLVSPLVPTPIIAQINRDSTVLELSPTMICVVLAGVVGGKIASELGNMRVSEQIDALEIMGINTKTYLILPKILSAAIIIPLLIIISISVSIFGGFLAGTLSGIITQEEFREGLSMEFKGYDIFFSLAKAFTFSLIITIIPSYYGYYVKGGALEIGRASTTAVVISCILILLFDYILSALLL